MPPEIFDLPPHGTLNIHDSLLPAYAGFSPLIWALINGEKEVGVTAHMMDAELDAGDIVLQRAVPVGPGRHRDRPVPQDGRPDRPDRRGGAGPDRLRPDATGFRRTAARRASSTSGRSRTAASTGPGRRRTSSGWCARSRTRTPTRSPTTAAGGIRDRRRRRCRRAATAAPRAAIFIREGDGVVDRRRRRGPERAAARTGRRTGPHRGRHGAAGRRLLPRPWAATSPPGRERGV